MSEIVKFPDRTGASRTSELRGMVREVLDEEVGPRNHHWARPYTRRGKSMQTFLFRSYELILESNEAELLHDVRLDTHKAEVKLRKVTERLQGERERSAALIKKLAAAEAKLTAAIVAALLSRGARKGAST